MSYYSKSVFEFCPVEISKLILKIYDYVEANKEAVEQVAFAEVKEKIKQDGKYFMFWRLRDLTDEEVEKKLAYAKECPRYFLKPYPDTFYSARPHHHEYYCANELARDVEYELNGILESCLALIGEPQQGTKKTVITEKIFLDKTDSRNLTPYRHTEYMSDRFKEFLKSGKINLALNANY